MDETRTSTSGHVESTPEAQPLDPTGTAEPSSSRSGGGATAGPSGGASAGPSASAPEDRAEEMARDVAQRLKPVAVAAEDVAAKAVNLSAKGLSRLARILEERRRQRGSGGQ